MENFFDEDEIELSNHILCKYCKKIFVEPVTLPCGTNICSQHIIDLLNENATFFFCKHCNLNHEFNNNQFPINEAIKFLVKKRSASSNSFDDLYYLAKQAYENYKSKLDELELINLSSDLFLDGYFSDLRYQVDVKREKLIQEIHNVSENLIKKIDKYESDFKNNSKLKKTNKLDPNVINEHKQKLDSYSNELNQFKIDLVSWKKIQLEAEQINLKLEKKIKKIKNDLLSFDKNIFFKESTLEPNLNDFFCSINEIDFTKYYLVSASGDNSIKIWDYDYGDCVQDLNEHTNIVYAIQATNDNKIVSGSCDKTIKIWNIYTGECIRTLHGHSNAIYALIITNDNKIISGSFDKSIKIWDFESGVCLHTLSGHADVVYAIKLTKNNSTLISCSGDKTIKLWNIADFTLINTLTGHSGWIISLELINNDKNLVSCSGDGKIKVWKLEDGNCMKTLTGHTDSIFASILTNDGRLITSSNDKTIKIWDLEKFVCIISLENHTDAIKALEITSNGYLVSGSCDNSIKIWNIDNNFYCIKTLTGHSNSVNSLVATKDGKIISGSYDNTIRIWDIESGKCLRVIDKHKKSIYSLKLIQSNVFDI